MFVNGTPLDLPRGSTILDAVRALDAQAATGVATRKRAVADSRGLAIDPAMPVTGGMVLRIVSARALRDDRP